MGDIEAELFDAAIIDAMFGEPIKKPAKAWRNWWKATESVLYGPPLCKRLQVGDVYQGDTAWPSKDVAEQKALSRQGRIDGWKDDEYLGAFPEGERP
jgi:hypothetical protein